MRRKLEEGTLTTLFVLVVFLAVLAIIGGAPADAKQPGTIRQKFDCVIGEYGGANITATNSIDVSTTTTYSDPIQVGGGWNEVSTSGHLRQFQEGSEYHAVYIKVNVTDAGGVVDVDLEIEVSRDGTNFYAVSPSITKNVTADWEAVWVVSLPPCKYIRLKCPNDGSNRTYSIEGLEIWRY